MSIENVKLCKRMPEIPEKSFIEKLSEFATFTEKGKQELAAKHKAEQEKLNMETRRLCAAELQERADKDFVEVSFSKPAGRFNPQSDLGGMLGLSQKQVIATNGTWKSKVDREKFHKIEDDKLTPELKDKKGEAVELSGKMEIHFRKALDTQWQKKMARYKSSPAFPQIQAFYEKNILPYARGEKDFHPISPEDYKKKVAESIRSARKIIGEHMEDGFAKYKIDKGSPRSKLAIALASKVNEDDLIGLSMTELLGNTGVNGILFDTLIIQGGEDYLLLIPSMNDPYLSYGPYQHTRLSINPTDASGNTGGARLADINFSGGKILTPNTTIENFPLSEQHTAAYLLTLNNIALLVKNIPEEIEIKREIPSKKGSKKKVKKYTIEKRNTIDICLKLLSEPNTKAGKDFSNAFIGFIAAAHNSPGATNHGFNNRLAEVIQWRLTDPESTGLENYIKAPTAANNAKNQAERSILKKDAPKGKKKRTHIPGNRALAAKDNVYPS